MLVVVSLPMLAVAILLAMMVGLVLGVVLIN